jgi:hypothetical protein
MGIFLIFLIFIHRLMLKVKRLKIALTLDESVEIVLLSGRQGWTQRSSSTWVRQRITDCCATVDPNMLSKIRTNMAKRRRKCIVSG